MSAVATQWVRSKPVNARAVQFDGTAGRAQAIMTWMKQNGLSCDGHFRSGVGGQPGLLFLPIQNDVHRVDPDDWVVLDGGMFFFLTPDQFAEVFEVSPCLQH